VICATAQWLLTAYPADGGVLGEALAWAQVRQAATIAGWLRYPTLVDAELVGLVGPGGSAGLDARLDAGLEVTAVGAASDEPWRTWVDEVIASWAACLLSDPRLARRAVDVAVDTEHAWAGCDFRRLTAPDHHDRLATPLVRHGDLVEPVAGLHRAALILRLSGAPAFRPTG
jgi:hypothetical protein